MLPLGRAPPVLSVPVACHPAHLTHCRHHTHPARRPHTRGCSISLSCCAGHELFLSTQEGLVPLRFGENPPRMVPMWPAQTRNQDGVTFLFSLRNTRVFLLQAIQVFLHYFLCWPVRAAAPCTALDTAQCLCSECEPKARLCHAPHHTLHH